MAQSQFERHVIIVNWLDPSVSQKAEENFVRRAGILVTQPMLSKPRLTDDPHNGVSKGKGSDKDMEAAV